MYARKKTIAMTSALLAAALLNAGCTGSGDGEPRAGSPPTTAPHGYVEGATESAEQQSRLVLGDPATGATRVLDLISGEVHDTGRRAGVTGLTTDGRFGYFSGADGTEVLDSGAWMVDHGDHVHYYRAKIRHVGRFPAGAGAGIRGDSGATVVTDSAGRAKVYRRADLERGTTGAAVELPGVFAGPVVPAGEHLIALRRADGGGTPRTVVLDRRGRLIASPGTGCEDPRGDAVTRRGVVFGCADGAVLVAGTGTGTGTDGGYTAVRIPYGAKTPERERAGAFRYRPGSATLTALAGKNAILVLDVDKRTWTRVETGPVVAANTAGAGSPLLVLRTDGALYGYDITTGRQLSATRPLLRNPSAAGAGKGPAPVIEVDRSRAYLNDPEGRRVYEIDYNDGLRIARTFDPGIRPVLMAETGR